MRLLQLAPLPAVLLLVACPLDNNGAADVPVKPDAPGIGTATAGNGTADIAFTPPANTGSATITEYTVTCAATGAVSRTGTGTSSPITVTGLQNGTTYSCSVTATSSAGTSDASAGVSVTPSGPPGAPTIGVVTAGNGSASVAFSAPSSNGGSAITGYTATCTATGQTTATGTGTASPIAISGLTNGTQYACSVIATNARGSSAASASANVTPATAPDAPTIGAATAGNGQASIAFTAPASNGGSAITTYAAVCTATGQTTAQANGSTSPITVTGMTNGVTYACNVRAANAIGSGPASADVSVKPVGPPSAPTIGAGTPGNATASVAFTAPSNDGGSAITGYTASCSASGATTQTSTGPASPLSVSNLVNGTAYLCSVTATNAVGTSSASATVSVTPRTVPSAPTIGTATAGNGSASVAFTANGNGGSNITSFTVSCTTGSSLPVTASGSTSPITVTGLTNNLQYSCSVVATNDAGNSTASTSVNVTPAPPTAPGAPTIGAATPGNGSASVAFTAPASNGGVAITGYTVSCAIGGAGTPVTGTGTASPITVSGLANGSTYLCSVTATNAVGTSAASGTVSVTPSGPVSTSGVMCSYSYNQTNTVALLLSQVSWACATSRTMTSTQVPDYPSAKTFSGNPNVMAVVNASITFTLTPSQTGSTTVGTHIVGWAKNGVKFEPSTAEQCPAAGPQATTCPSSITSGTWNVEALGQTLFSAGVDSANAHVQPNGAYHYHGMPDKYLSWLSSNGASTNATPIVQHYLIGFAVDGFPIYAKYGYDDPTNTSSTVRVINSSYRKKLTLPAGRIDTVTVKYGTFTQDWEYVAGLGDLDDCNGRFGKTPDFPNGIYHYYITVAYPYIQRCHKGTVPPTQP